jgi:inner membrane protein
MDNITHTLTGVILSRAGLNRVSPHATLLMLLAVNAPDAGLHRYRDPLHSLIGIAVLALLVVALARLLLRKSIAWGRAYMVALVGVTSNPLLNCLNPFGVRLLWPFSGRWFHLDVMPGIDIWLLALLAAGLAGPWLSRLVNWEMGVKSKPSHGAAIAVVCLALLYGFGRFLLHQRAIAVLESRMYQGETPLRVAAIPTMANPLRWVGLVEGRGFVEMHSDLNLLEDFNPTAGTLYYKPDAQAVIAIVSQTKPFQVFLDAAQWPVWKITPVPKPEGGLQVEVWDPSLGPASRATAILDADKNPILQQ